MNKKRILFLALVQLVLLISTIQPAAATKNQPPPDEDLEHLVDRLIRCSEIDGENYCLVIGFTALKPGTPEWGVYVSQALAQPDYPGDMSLTSELNYRGSLPEGKLKEIEAREFAAATDAVGRIKLINHLVEREPIPDGFFNRYPSLGFEENSPQAAELRRIALTGEPINLTLFHTPTHEELLEEQERRQLLGNEPVSIESSPPSSRHIIRYYYREQEESYWCGPATMESIGDSGGYGRTQQQWATELGTTPESGTALSNIVDAINEHTFWADSSHGGAYVVVGLSGKAQSYYVGVHKTRIGIYGAPVVEHVMLYDQYFTYLAKDWSGHYQTGRGYSDYTSEISIFEPFDERDWYWNGNNTGMIQYVSYANMWYATQAHSQKNMGG